jgi:hypothetical protein
MKIDKLSKDLWPNTIFAKIRAVTANPFLKVASMKFSLLFLIMLERFE